MPKSSLLRFIPKHFVPVGLDDVNRAWTKVWWELETMGLACRRLSTCQVYLGIVHTAYGYQWYGDRGDGRHCGDIVLPSVSLSRWSDFISGRPFTTVVDVLRHEYGHAYADVNRRRIESRAFENAFGYPHEWWDGYELEHDPYFHVTPYAATAPAEDFAEVFWLYLKHKGDLPRKFASPPIKKKWEFVSRLRKSA
jgi:hypothetical protein